jgi:endonuclease-8
MPEGHTIHRAARLQRALLEGRTLRVDSPQGRFADEAAELDGAQLHAIDAYGKHLFYDFGGEQFVHVHLGLFGTFRMGTGAPPQPRGAIRVRFITDDGWVTLSGPAACDLIGAAERKLLLARIGPDPLNANARPAAMIARIAGSSSPIGILLMDQSVVAGIGNVYRSELLFRARINPWTKGSVLDDRAARALWKDARALMRAGERSGRIVTTGNARRDERYYVYGRMGLPCRSCGEPIARASMGARTVYWCPICQITPRSAQEAPRRKQGR